MSELLSQLNNNPAFLTLFVLTLVATAISIGLIITRIKQARVIHALELHNQQLLTEQTAKTTAHEAQLAALERQSKQQIEQLKDSFQALSAEALRHNNQDFLRVATQRFEQLKTESNASLAQKEQSFANLVKPISEALNKTGAEIQRMERERKQAFGSITEQLSAVSQSQQSLQSETRNLVTALRRPEVRGRWGEITLKRLVEIAGLVEHCDFYQQTSSDDNKLRPDMLVRLPGERQLVIDAKTPLDAYFEILEADDEPTRNVAVTRHIKVIREHIKKLASKDYWASFQGSLDFVVMFVPGEQFLAQALEADQNLLEDALTQKIILATPTNLIALLRTVAYGWRQESLNQNAEQIRDSAEELYARMVTFSEHLARHGNSLKSSVDHYNKAIGSFERQILPSMRRFREMGIEAKKDTASPDILEHDARDFSALTKQDN